MRHLVFPILFFSMSIAFAQVTTSSSGRVKEIKTDFGFEQIDGQYNRTVLKSGWLSEIGDYLSIKHGGGNVETYTYGLRISDGHGFDFGRNDFATSFIKVKTNGYVGIGTSNPQYKLTLNGGSFSIGDGGNGIPFKIWAGSSGTTNHLRIGSDIGHYGDAVVELYQNYGGGTEQNPGKLVVNGDLAIGTSRLGGYRLSVKGKIRAEEIKVETGWADYVFKEDYDLPTLEEVEKHIQEKGHLINIPSAKEVEENGIQLGEMNKLLLEKIEELTLYVIELKKEINKLKQDKK
ncbi:hypothetical protein [Ascidiimonas aurantiaca]|uniref:hypothetical protein n=1 Tax=Ascidiimonas aurantiaca TaxID=1685432 RepID=UPI0030EF65C9